MLTVPEAARRVGRNPETIRRWIRSGRLPSTKVGTQHMIDEEALDEAVAAGDVLDLPAAVHETVEGRRQPDWAAIIRDIRNRPRHP